MDLKQKVNDLEQIIKVMSEKIEHLQSMVLRLSICKLEDPRHPYYNWTVSMNISEEKKCLAETVLAILAVRLDGQKVTDYKKDIEGISSEILYKDEAPNYKDAERMLMTVLELNHKGHIPQLLKKIYAEGRFEKICEYLLNEIGEDIFDE
jgi:hypothetical protein